MSSICAAPVSQMVQAGLGRRHEDSSATRAYPERVLPERMNQARCLACSENFHEESHGIGQAPNAGGIGKGHQTNSGFSARWTTHSATGRIRNAPRLKLHGASAGFANRAGCFYITFSAIIAPHSIVATTQHTPKHDISDEEADETR